MTATVTKLYAGDKDAIKIGNRIAAAKESAIDTVKNFIEAGQMLIKKKEDVGHGNWLPWLKENEDVIGFAVQKNGCKTAERLMKFAKSNPTLTSDFTEAAISQINKGIWGNTSKTTTKKKSKSSGGGGGSRSATAKQVTKARKIVRPMVAAGESIDYNKLGKEHGISHVTVEKAAAIETALLYETTNIDALSQTAKDKLEIAKRMIERKLDAEHAQRMRGLDEEVRQRVLTQGKEYLAKLNAMEQEARDTVELYKKLINNNKPLFTVDQFKTVLMCLHPDGQRTTEKLNEAFVLFESRKEPLTGKNHDLGDNFDLSELMQR